MFLGCHFREVLALVAAFKVFDARLFEEEEEVLLLILRLALEV